MSFFDKIKSGLNSIVSSAERSLESSPCEICEKQLSFYEKKHLADGFICGACFEKASPYFIQKHKKQKATVEQFKAHLHDRQKNAAAFREFSPTLILGDYTQILIDEDHHKFIVYCAQEHKRKSYAEANIDILDCSSVLSCNVDIEENKTEVETNASGSGIAFYEYTYDFYVIIGVNHPYIDQIRIKLNPEEIENMGTLYRKYEQLAKDICSTLMERKNASRESNANQLAFTVCPWCGTKLSHAIGTCEHCGGTL